VRSLGGQRRFVDHLVAVVGVYERDAAAVDQFTLVEAVRDGWWYSAPIPGGVIVAFCTDADICSTSRIKSPQRWSLGISSTTHTSARIGGSCMVREPAIFSAASRYTTRTDWSSRWLAVGDAALSVDPLSSSGLVRALATGIIGAEAIVLQLAGKLDAIEAYDSLLREDLDGYMAERQRVYQRETRWLDSTFWRRRAAAVS
jgi:hypothetical protein